MQYCYEYVQYDLRSGFSGNLICWRRNYYLMNYGSDLSWRYCLDFNLAKCNDFAKKIIGKILYFAAKFPLKKLAKFREWKYYALCGEKDQNKK